MNDIYLNKDWKAYLTYGGDKQKFDYNLKESEHIKLIDIYKGLPLDNINHINHHYSQIISMYYVWKNQIKSDYVCIWDHRRFFIPINFDKLDNDEIQVFFHVTTDLTPFEYMFKEGINEYIIYQFIKYMIEKRGVDHDKIIDLIFNKSWNQRLWLITGFNCNWKVFNDICDFTFDFVDYIIPNGDHTNYDSIEQFIQDMKRSILFLKTKCKDREIICNGRIESEDRDIGNVTECLYPLFCELMGYGTFTEWDPKTIIINIPEYNKDTIFDELCKCVYKNVWTGCKTFKVLTSENNKEYLQNMIDNSGWKIFHYHIDVISQLPEDYDYIKIELNQYIDSETPLDELDITKIKQL